MSNIKEDLSEKGFWRVGHIETTWKIVTKVCINSFSKETFWSLLFQSLSKECKPFRIPHNHIILAYRNDLQWPLKLKLNIINPAVQTHLYFGHFKLKYQTIIILVAYLIGGSEFYILISNPPNILWLIPKSDNIGSVFNLIELEAIRMCTRPVFKWPFVSCQLNRLSTIDCFNNKICGGFFK